MSVKYIAQDGSIINASGLTPGGNLEAGAVATRSGVATIGTIAAQTTGSVAITFDSPMPDNDYIVYFNPNTNKLNMTTGSSKTTEGFTLFYHNITDSQAADAEIQWEAIKTYTVQHDVQNTEAITSIQSVIPSGAGSGNQLTTKSYVDNADASLDGRVSDLEDLIPAAASVTNQLVTKSEASVDNALSASSEHAVQNKVVKAALDGKQDTLQYDNLPTENSEKMVKSKGIYNSENEIWKAMGEKGAKNILSYPFSQTTLTNKEVTFIDVGDGTVTTSGTASGGNGAFRVKNSGELPTSGRYILSGCTGGSTNTYYIAITNASGSNARYNGSQAVSTNGDSIEFDIADLTDGNGNPLDPSTLKLYLIVNNGTNADGKTFKPMLRLASDTDSTFQPYAMTNQELTNEKVDYELNKITGVKNFLKYPDKTYLESNGIVWTYNSDGSVTATGATSSILSRFIYFSSWSIATLLNPGTYTLSGLPNNSGENSYYIDYSYQASILHLYEGEATFTISEAKRFTIDLVIAPNVTLPSGGITFYPMLRWAKDKNNTYYPYAMSNYELTQRSPLIIYNNTHTDDKSFFTEAIRAVIKYFKGTTGERYFLIGGLATDKFYYSGQGYGVFTNSSVYIEMTVANYENIFIINAQGTVPVITVRKFEGTVLS